MRLHQTNGDRIDELAWRAGGRTARILGHTMAHELGHLLLGANAHSPSGIMRGVWLPEDLKFMRWGELTFTLRQSDQIRNSLLRRARLGVSSGPETASQRDSSPR